MIQQRKIKHYGWRPQLPDIRDHTMRLVSPKLLPRSVDLSIKPFMPSIWDQGNLGSCVGNAVARAFEYELRSQGLADFSPSRLAIYYDARKIEHATNEDSGCIIRDAIKVVAKLGAGPEPLWPYIESKFANQPSAEYYTTAAKTVCVSYEAVDQTQYAIKTALASGFLVVFGISVFDSFESDAVAKTGIVPIPKSSESLLGGHAISMCGYTSADVKSANSWGQSWGKRGFFTLPWNYVLDPSLASDFWIIKVIS